MENNKDLRFAVLIDADNIPYRNVKGMLEEIAKYGTPTFKRIYGDWTDTKLSGWKSVLLQNAITPIQQYGYTTGKNATDSAMIIDAMDILYSKKVDGFCLVSSDSDFTRLALRLREGGMQVVGMGEKKTPAPFRVACNKFVYIEVLESQETESTETSEKKIHKKSSVFPKSDKALHKLILQSINDLADEDGWTFLGSLGNLILKKQPDFDPRNYGFKKLLPLIKSLKGFETDERDSGKNNIKLIYVRAI